ncbi:A/G-specific adenine glycosylase [Nocardioides sp. zg-536]|uniref:Adenine DNA glycosylase n=1 Tax=Nocardioides faecalis TaxID=2803858 RepID=A0A938Y868_9ACTN|nr:A/G-specific adenine glycosylase [Nocardioides faecalis]MBM9461060.1 A/G-specific adenine glycosylase [Nocardioides faecalis]MBS4752034.1 A/G-specific adenine glycosylase [Nocardioides faecalis]QVI59145.1 A/G-specific adenine glycosylase [Nocardioides faecalis]
MTTSTRAPLPTPEQDVQRDLVAPILDWYDEHARDLPWRRPEATPWSVLVSELMLQQTPVSRVLAVHEAWLQRWPTPAALAAEPSGEAVRAWGRLGYPRRALRLHAAAVAITTEHGGEVPADHAALLALPGVGEYTAAAVAAFAFGQRQVVLDTNVRRVLARTVTGTELPPRSLTRAERDLGAALLPADPPTAATWSVAVMELGALVCVAERPRCEQCPVRDACAWQLAGAPSYDGPPRRVQTYAGTDRQCRGRLLAVLRETEGSVDKARLDVVWDDDVQRERALASLLADGLAVLTDEGRYALP